MSMMTAFPGRRSQLSLPEWEIGTYYYSNQLRLAANGSVARCKLDHLAAEDNAPFSGANWQTYWEAWIDALPANPADGAVLVGVDGAWVPSAAGVAGNIPSSDQKASFAPGANAEERHLSLSDMIHSTHYAASDRFSTPTIVVPADRRSLLVPTDGGIKIGDGFFRWSGIPNIDLDVAANWDDSQYADPLVRRGVDFGVFACRHAGQLAPDFVLSANVGTYPIDYDATDSRKIGGFPTMPINVGTISGHPYSGYLAGDPVFTGIWCLLNRPACPNPAGMVWMGHPSLTYQIPDLWVDIWMQSGTGANAASVYGASITDTRSWNDHRLDLAAVGKFLPSITQFPILAAGGPEQVNVYLSQDPVKTGKLATRLFTGAGLNDLTAAHAAFAHANFRREYEIEIDATGTPDTYKIRERDFGGSWGDYTTGVPIVSGPVSLSSGGTFTFAATTGHTPGNKWNVAFMDAPFATNGVPMLAHSGIWMPCGGLWHWTDTPSMRIDSVASHTHQVVASGNPETITSGAASADIVPSWQWYDASYQQGPYGQSIMLVAGGGWNLGSYCGSRSQHAAHYRWDTSSGIGARACARSRMA